MYSVSCKGRGGRPPNIGGVEVVAGKIGKCVVVADAVTFIDTVP